jgi:hypothetical protein
MLLSQAQARELGEALLDAAEATKTENNQAIVILDGVAVAVPFNEDIQDLYETPLIVQV